MRLALLFATVIATNITPAPGQIGANYFDSLNQSQVWINVEPASFEPGASPIELNATVSFPGRTLPTQPRSVDLRVQAYCFAAPTRVRIPVFTLDVDGVAWRLDGDLPLQLSAACGNDVGTTDVIVGRLSFAEFRAMTMARQVTIHALGFDARLDAPHLRALATFAEAVAAGVTVK
jgi:hypothetical protein